MVLDARQRKALDALRYETDYEDGRNGSATTFIERSRMPVGCGEGTMRHLVDSGYAETGQNEATGKEGYRITEAGRAAMRAPRTPALPKPTGRKLQTLEPLLREAPPRIGKLTN